MNFQIIHHADQAAINKMYREYSPVFVLSTGRSGTKLVAVLLNASPSISAFHEPRPTLQYFSDYSFRNRDKQDMLSRIFNVARMEMILDVFIHDKIYVESNQCLTYYAPAISRLFPKSKFIHIIRHPGDFIRSGIQKGWYVNDSIWESGRPRMLDLTAWGRLDHVEKLAWLWNTANGYIDEFKKTLTPERFMTVKMEKLSSSKNLANKLVLFVGAEAIPPDKLKSLLKNKVNSFFISPGEPPNLRKIAVYPEYHEWSNIDKQKVRRFTAEKSREYRYEL